MNVILGFAPLIFAAMTAVNWAALARRSAAGITTSENVSSPPLDAVLRGYFAPMIGWFLLLGGCQLGARVPDVFHLLGGSPTNPFVATAWLSLFALDAYYLIQLLRPGIPEALRALGLMRFGRTPGEIRVMGVAMLLLNTSILLYVFISGAAQRFLASF